LFTLSRSFKSQSTSDFFGTGVISGHRGGGYFVDVVTKQAIERQLLAPLVEILSPKSIAGYTDETVHHIAAEPFEIRQLRSHLENKRKMLEDGEGAFQAVVANN
jgi:hypothetical protein